MASIKCLCEQREIKTEKHLKILIKKSSNDEVSLPLFLTTTNYDECRQQRLILQTLEDEENDTLKTGLKKYHANK